MHGSYCLYPAPVLSPSISCTPTQAVFASSPNVSLPYTLPGSCLSICHLAPSTFVLLTSLPSTFPLHLLVQLPCLILAVSISQIFASVYAPICPYCTIIVFRSFLQFMPL